MAIEKSAYQAIVLAKQDQAVPANGIPISGVFSKLQPIA
jgi:hypothetical protein